MDADRLNPAAGPASRAGEEALAGLMDRVLLYLRGMDIPPVRALELALECLRRLEAGSDPPSMASGMKELHALLRESGFHTGWITRDEAPRGSMPPLNRCSMVAEKMEFSFWPRRPRSGRSK